MTNNGCDLLLDYFNEALENDEKLQFEQHLKRCRSCQEELTELATLTKDLPYLSEPVDTPQGMKERVLKAAFEDDEKEGSFQSSEAKILERQPEGFKKRQKSTTMFILAASLFISLLGNLYAYSIINNKAPQQEGVTHINQLVKMVEMKSTEQGKFVGTAALVEKNGILNVVIQADQLKAVSGKQVYQVWLLEEKTPYRAGTFVPNQDGRGAVTFSIPYTGDHKWETVAITLEPNQNSETPLGEVVLASEL